MAAQEKTVAAPTQKLALYRKLLGTVAGIEDKTNFRLGLWPPSSEMVAVTNDLPADTAALTPWMERRAWRE